MRSTRGKHADVLHRSKATAHLVFLQELSRTGNFGLGCRKAKLTREHIAGLQAADEEFSRAVLTALKNAQDLLLAEARRRALKGVATPIISGGRPLVEPETGKPLQSVKYSDALLMLLLRKDDTRHRTDVESQKEHGDALCARLSAISAIGADSDPFVAPTPC